MAAPPNCGNVPLGVFINTFVNANFINSTKVDSGTGGAVFGSVNNNDVAKDIASGTGTLVNKLTSYETNLLPSGTFISVPSLWTFLMDHCISLSGSWESHFTKVYESLSYGEPGIERIGVNGFFLLWYLQRPYIPAGWEPTDRQLWYILSSSCPLRLISNNDLFKFVSSCKVRFLALLWVGSPLLWNSVPLRVSFNFALYRACGLMLKPML